MTLKEREPIKLGFLSLTMLTLGSMIGAGIFVVPNALRVYGTVATMGWIIATICALFLANTFSDLAVNGEGKSFPLAIGDRLGQLSGFMAGFNQWAFYLFASTEIVFTAANYLLSFAFVHSNLIQFYLVAALSILAFILHSRSKIGLKLVEGVTSIKLLLFFFISLLGILSFNFTSVFGGLRFDWAQIIQAIQAASITIFAFAGLDSAAVKASDAKDPKRTIPLVINTSTLICAGVYLLTHCCVMSSGTHSDTPVVSAMQLLAPSFFGQYLAKILSGVAVFVGAFGCLGTFLAVTFISPASIEDSIKMANPTIVLQKTKTGVPLYLSLAQYVAIIIMAYLKYIMGVDLNIVLEVASFSLVIFYFYCVILSISTRPKRIAMPALIVCGILLSGCSLQSVFLGSILQMLGQAFFALNLKRRKV